MPKKLLTATVVQKTKAPAGKRLKLHDSALPGFFVLIGSRTRVFYLATRITGKQVKIRIGEAKVGDGPGLTLSEARQAASEMLEQISLGVDPRQKREAVVAENRKRAASTVSAVSDLYIERYAKARKRTWREDQRILDMYVKPLWGPRPIADITKADVVDLLDEIEAGQIPGQRNGGFYQANRALAVIRKMFNWAMDERALIDAIPIGRKMARGVEGSRKRAMSDNEVRSIWSAADEVGGFKGNAVKMLMLTGQRKGVVAGMKWSEIEGGVLNIPESESGRSKNKLEHLVPLSRQALAILETVPIIADKDCIFGTGARGDKSLSIGSKLKNEIDEKAGFSDWRWNDIRGLVATRMLSPLAISRDIVNRVQGRLDQSVLGRHYDSNEYLEEKRRALQAWADYLDIIVAGRAPDNVVELINAKA
jgi:integrase